MDDKTKKIIGTIHEISKNFGKRKVPKFFVKDKVCHLTLGQMSLLAYLYENKKAKMSELAENAGVTMPTMTEMVNKLVSANILTREHDEKDRRTVWVYITKEAEKKVNLHIEERNKRISELIKCLTSQEKDQLIDILTKIKNKFERMKENE